MRGVYGPLARTNWLVLFVACIAAVGGLSSFAAARAAPSASVAPSLVFAAGSPPAIFRLDTGTGRLRRVTRPPLSAFQPQWSPDGTKIVFAGRRQDDRLALYEANADGTALERLPGSGAAATRVDGSPSWSPDGLTIGYVEQEPVALQVTRDWIWLTNPDGTNPRLLVNQPSVRASYGSALLWSPDASHLLFVSQPGISTVGMLTTVDLATASSHQIAANAVNPVWAPDGKRVAFIRPDSTGAALVVADADGANTTIVLTVAPGESLQTPRLVARRTVARGRSRKHSRGRFASRTRPPRRQLQTRTAVRRRVHRR